MYVDLKRNEEILQCPACNRILYLRAAVPVASPRAVSARAADESSTSTSTAPAAATPARPASASHVQDAGRRRGGRALRLPGPRHQQRRRVPGPHPRAALRAGARRAPRAASSRTPSWWCARSTGAYKVKHPDMIPLHREAQRAAAPLRGARASPTSAASRTARPTAWPTARWTRRPRSWSSLGPDQPTKLIMRPASRPVAPVGVVEVGAAERAVVDVVDRASARRPGRAELARVGGAHVEVGPPARAGAEEGLAAGAEGRRAAPRPPRSSRRRCRARARPGGPRAASPRATRAVHRGRARTPAAVPRQPAWAARHRAAARIDEQHGQAVGGLDPEQQARAGPASGRVAFGPALPGRLAARRAPWTCCSRSRRPERGERRGHARRGPRPRSSQPRGPEPLLEPVDEAGESSQRRHGGRRAGCASRSSCPMRKPRRDRLEIVGDADDVVGPRGRGPGHRRGRRAADRGRGPLPSREAERAYARAKSDPERRLAARLAAKRAAVRLLGGGVAAGRRRGPPRRAAGRRTCALGPGARAAAPRWARTARW